MFNVRHSENDKLKGGLSVKKIGWVPEMGDWGLGKCNPTLCVCWSLVGLSARDFFFSAENKGTPWEGGRISLTPIWSQPLIGYASSSILQITKALG